MATGTGKYTVDGGSFSIQRNMMEFRYRIRDPGIVSPTPIQPGDVYVLFDFGPGESGSPSQKRHVSWIYHPDGPTLDGPQVIHASNSLMNDFKTAGSHFQWKDDLLYWLSAAVYAGGEFNFYASTLDTTAPSTWSLHVYPTIPGPASNLDPDYVGPFVAGGKLFFAYTKKSPSGTTINAGDGVYVFSRNIDDFTSAWDQIHFDGAYVDCFGVQVNSYYLVAARELSSTKIVLLLVGSSDTTCFFRAFTLVSVDSGSSWSKSIPDDYLGFGSSPLDPPGNFNLIPARQRGQCVVGSTLVASGTRITGSGCYWRSIGRQGAGWLAISTDGASFSSVAATRSGGYQSTDPASVDGAFGLVGNAAGQIFFLGRFDPSYGSVETFDGTVECTPPFGPTDTQFWHGAAHGTTSGGFAGIGPLVDDDNGYFLSAHAAVFDEERGCWWVAASNKANLPLASGFFDNYDPSLVRHYLLKLDASYAEVARVPLAAYIYPAGDPDPADWIANTPLAVGKFPPGASGQP